MHWERDFSLLRQDLAAHCICGEQLVQPTHALEIPGDMQANIETLIILFVCWDKWLILSHFPNGFLLLSALALVRTIKLRLKLNAISLENQVCSALCFPC